LIVYDKASEYTLRASPSHRVLTFVIPAEKLVACKEHYASDIEILQINIMKRLQELSEYRRITRELKKQLYFEWNCKRPRAIIKEE